MLAMRRMQQREEDKVAKAAQKSASDRIRSEQRASRAIEAEAKRSATARIREEEALDSRIQRIRTRNRRRRVREARAEAERDGRYRQGTFRSIGSGLGSGARAVGAVGAALVGVGGAMLARDSVDFTRTKHGAAAALANQAVGPGEARSREELKRSYLGLAESEGARTKLGAEATLGMMRSYAAVSGTRGMEQALPFMGELAAATDSAPEDVGASFGSVFTSLMRDPAMKLNDALSETTKIMLALGGQAKVGSIELKDMASQVGKLMTSVSGYKGDKAQLATSMGAIAQMSILTGAGSPEEAMTSIQRLATDLGTHSDKIGKLKGADGKALSVFTDKTNTQMRDPVDIIRDVLRATGGDRTKILDIFGERSIRAFDVFQQPFAASLQRAKAGGMKGQGAVDFAVGEAFKPYNEIVGASMTRDEVTKSAQFRADQPDRTWSNVMEDLHTKVGNRLLPVFDGFVAKLSGASDNIARLTEVVTSVVAFFAENPFKGLGLLVAGIIGKEMVAAQIGSVVKGALGSGGAAATLSTGVGGKLGKMGKLGKFALRAGKLVPILGTALAAGELASETGLLDYISEGLFGGPKTAAGSGSITDEDKLSGRITANSDALPALQHEREGLTKRMAAVRDDYEIAQRRGDSATAEAKLREFNAMSEQLTTNSTAINKLQTEIAKLTEALKGSPLGKPDRSGAPINGTEPRG